MTEAGGRLVLLATTHRTAPGLLSWEAWQALHGADHVLAGDADHPQRPPVEAAGVRVDVVEAAAADALARQLVATAANATVVWLSGTDGDPELGAALAHAIPAASARGDNVPELELIHGSYDLPGARVLDLVAVMDRLRSPGGCPWDAEQTHRSLVTYLIEEAYELVEAIETGDRDHLREELGDLLLQVVFHARIAEEHAGEPWSVDDVAGGIVEKLVRRHPHVFGDAEAATAEHVAATWELNKAEEKGRGSAVEGVPLSLPALALAVKLMQRAERMGVDVGRPRPVAAPATADPHTIGELLLGIAAVAHDSGVDPEQALRDAVRRFADNIRAAEASRS